MYNFLMKRNTNWNKGICFLALNTKNKTLITLAKYELMCSVRFSKLNVIVCFKDLKFCDNNYLLNCFFRYMLRQNFI